MFLISLFASLLISSPVRADAATDYKNQCALCHGATGAADGMMSSKIQPTPAKFSDAVFWASADDAQLKLVIKKGGPAVGKAPTMPPLGGGWSEAQLDAMVAYLKTFQR